MRFIVLRWTNFTSSKPSHFTFNWNRSSFVGLKLISNWLERNILHLLFQTSSTSPVVIGLFYRGSVSMTTVDKKPDSSVNERRWFGSRYKINLHPNGARRGLWFWVGAKRQKSKRFQRLDGRQQINEVESTFVSVPMARRWRSRRGWSATDDGKWRGSIVHTSPRLLNKKTYRLP